MLPCVKWLKKLSTFFQVLHDLVYSSSLCETKTTPRCPTQFLCWKIPTGSSFISKSEWISLPGPLSCCRAGEKAWSAARRAGETHQAVGNSASFWSVSKSLSEAAGRFSFTSRCTATFFQACVNVLGSNLGEKIILEWPTATIVRGGRIGTNGAGRRDECPAHRHALKVIFVHKLLNISRCFGNMCAA